MDAEADVLGRARFCMLVDPVHLRDWQIHLHIAESSADERLVVRDRPLLGDAYFSVAQRLASSCCLPSHRLDHIRMPSKQKRVRGEAGRGRKRNH